MTIDTLKVVITAETEKLNNSLKQTQTGLKNTQKQAKKTSSNTSQEFKKLGKNLALAHIAVQLIMKAIQKLGQMIKKGISNAYEYSKAMGGDFAKNVDKLKGSFETLTNALGSALVPLINALLPTITSVVDKLADLATGAGKIIATLTGQKTFVQAKKNVEEYTEAVKKATLGFDELNIVDSGKDKDNIEDKFEEVDISEEIFSLPDLFKRIEDSASGAIKKVNTFFHNTNWSNVGKTIAESLNGIINLIDTIFVETDWTTIGNSIMTGLMSFIENTDWSKIIRTAFHIITGALDLLAGLVENIDWDVWFDTLFDTIFTTIDEIINGDFLEKLFETAGVLVGKLIEGHIKLFIKKIELLQGIIDAIRTYFEGKIEECGGDVGQGLLKGIGDAFIGIGTWIYEKIVGPLLDGLARGFGLEGGRNAILDIFTKAFTNVKIFFENVGIFFENTWNGMWNGIERGLITAVNFLIQKLNEFVQWITNGPVGSTLEWLADILGIDKTGLINARNGTLVTQIQMPDAYMAKEYKSYVEIDINDYKKKTETATEVQGGGATDPTLINKLKKNFAFAQLAQGGVVNKATNAIIGENGKEAVLPLENNTEWIDLLAEKINANNPSRISLNVDGKQLGYAVINNINNITKQTGSLQLSLG